MEMNLLGGELEIAKLWHSLCVQLTGLPEDSVHSFYEGTLAALGCTFESSQEEDETKVAEQIVQSFIRKHKEKEAVRFSDLYRRLRSPALDGVLSRRLSLLKLLLTLRDVGEHQGTTRPTLGTYHLRRVQSQPTPRPEFWPPDVGRAAAEVTQELSASAGRTQVIGMTSHVGQKVLRDVLFCLQGVSSSLVQFHDLPLGSFTVDPECQLSGPQRQIVRNLAVLGRLRILVDGFCRPETMRRGLLCEAFVGALQAEMAEYYRILALLDAQLNPSEGNAGALTLPRVVTWMSKSMTRYRFLGDLVQLCAELKGGELASRLHGCLANGDPEVSALARRLLIAVLQPWYNMLCRWIQTGQLEDVHHEFFIAMNSNISVESLWHDKYYLRKSMMPSFLSEEQARKILCTGKAVNFLHHVCQISPPGTSLIREVLISWDHACAVECLLDGQQEDSFLEFLEQAYHTRNCRVLSVFNTEFKFKEHLQALRQFLLLGQGDFVRHLMDVLDEQLSQPAQLLRDHSLKAALDEAVRTTNAQFVDPEMLKRLEIQLLDINPGDTGWDVFSLFYRVDGPIGMVFTPYCMSVYLRLFNHMWRTKHMEYVATAAWMQQTIDLKVKNRQHATESRCMLHQCHILLSEMIHFMQQVQYYMVFEVIECAWAELESRVEQAQDLDQVIHAHDDFLAALMTRALLEPESRDILSQLRSIFDQVLRFKEVQGELLSQLTSGTSSLRAQASLRMISDSYQRLVQDFLLSLSRHDDTNLQGLGFRLDFSEFYNRQNVQLRTSMTFHSRRQYQGSSVQV
ncbi:gamma-tubulin complex component 3 homolog [Dermacentor andersoni]|uniref:gamma-tubulin complex component 3 homolog n=1 Tax=Dermacentor andersoni TaxID=34620 RepID=UPI003B3A8DEB